MESPAPTADYIARIIVAACREFGEDIEDMIAGRRFMMARHAAYAAIHRQFPNVSGPAIGRMLLARDHKEANSYASSGYIAIKMKRPQVATSVVKRILAAAKALRTGAKNLPDLPDAPAPASPASPAPPAEPEPPPPPSHVMFVPTKAVQEFGEAMVAGEPVFPAKPMDAARLREIVRNAAAAVPAKVDTMIPWRRPTAALNVNEEIIGRRERP